MRIIVTGASGFIGRNVLLRSPRDWQIVAAYHESTDFEAFLRQEDLVHVTPVRCDLRREGEAGALATASGGRADAALYLAANGDPSLSVRRPTWDLQSNTMALIEFLERCPVEHVVYVSSGAVYDGLVGPVSPATAVSPRLPYAISKLASEQYVRFFAERRRALKSYVNVRFFGAYGPHEPARKITTRWIRSAIEDQREFSVRGNGQNLIDFMYVDDAVDGFLRLTRAAGEFSGTLDFAAGWPLSVNHVVEAMAGVIGGTITVRHEGHTEEYIQFRTVDTILRDRFGFVPGTSFEQGMAKLHRFLVREGHGAP